MRKAETNGVQEFCRKNGMGMLGFSPLCQGILTGKYRAGVPENSRMAKSKRINYNKTANFYQQNKERIDRYFEICDELRLNPTSIAIKWPIHKGIYPVLGASRLGQLSDTLSDLPQEIDVEIWNRLEKI